MSGEPTPENKFEPRTSRLQNKNVNNVLLLYIGYKPLCILRRKIAIYMYICAIALMYYSMHVYMYIYMYVLWTRMYLVYRI
jgi:hypothetical protein